MKQVKYHRQKFGMTGICLPLKILRPPPKRKNKEIRTIQPFIYVLYPDLSADMHSVNTI